MAPKQLHLHPKRLIDEFVNMAVEDGKIVPAIVVGIEELSPETERIEAGFSQIGFLGSILKKAPRLREIESIRLFGKVGDE